MNVIPYSSNMVARWDEFIKECSSNGTIFHEQKFLSYHKDRFIDASIMIYEGEKIIGVLPAVHAGNQIVSHAGATYGGVVFREDIKLKELYDMIDVVICYYKANFKGVQQIKMVLSEIFLGSDKGLSFCLWQHGFSLLSKEVSTVISIDHFFKYQGMRKTTRQYLHSKKYDRVGTIYRKATAAAELAGAYGVIADNLENKYAKKPTHSYEEFFELLNLYPDDISVFIAESEGEIVATYVVFALNHKVAHVFYIASKPDRTNVSDIGLVHFIVSYYKDRGFSFVNFGISSRGFEVKWWIHNYKEQFSKLFLTRDAWGLDMSLNEERSYVE